MLGVSHADSPVLHIRWHSPCLGLSVKEIWGGKHTTSFVWKYFIFLPVLSRVLLFLFYPMVLVLDINTETKKTPAF